MCGFGWFVVIPEKIFPRALELKGTSVGFAWSCDRMNLWVRCRHWRALIHRVERGDIGNSDSFRIIDKSYFTINRGYPIFLPSTTSRFWRQVLLYSNLPLLPTSGDLSEGIVQA